MVLQELDKLKLQKEKAVSFLATRAIRYINNKFKEGHAKIQGKENGKWPFLLKRWPHMCDDLPIKCNYELVLI